MALSTFLVEDNRTIRDNLIPALEDLADATVVGTAEAEADAVRWLSSHPDDWQLLVVDLFLKEGSGLGVLRTCAHRPSSKRVVVLSNYINADIRARCMALGADAVFDKSRELEAFFAYCNDNTGSRSKPH
ncbi:response regulator [Variovorax sp. GT1P44]|uniref:response regulator n=1 Tax=Variovorax sp. GT1P44 TaxID=3443742 RepID=UPI003F47F831